MSEEKDEKSADEIVDDLAEEMGVQDEKVPDSDESADDLAGDLGGIFGVQSSKKTKKKKKKQKKKRDEAAAEEDDADEDDDSIPFDDIEEGEAEEEEPETEEDEEEQAEEEQAEEEQAEEEEQVAAAKRNKKKEQAAAVEGILTPASDDEDVDVDDDYLGAEDLGDYDAPKGKTVPALWGIIIVLVLAIGAGAVFALDLGDDLVALFKGELKEKRIQEAQMAKEQHREEQLAALDRFGTLVIGGHPKYALLRLNGQTQYGKTTQGWRELRLGPQTAFQNLNIEDDYQLLVTNPGFEDKTIRITEGMWQEAPSGGDFIYNVTSNLTPVSVEAKQEFDARMSQDEDREFYGTVTINSTPPGAKIIFNNSPLMDEEGEELVTPVTFDKYWVREDEEDENSELEEREIRVDSALDVGHKVEVMQDWENMCPEGQATPPKCGAADGCCPQNCTVAQDDDCKWPKYITSLQRQMWTCNWEDGSPPESVPSSKSVQEYCEYSFTLDVDFNGLKNYIIRREEEKQRILDQHRAASPDAGTAEQAAAAE